MSILFKGVHYSGGYTNIYLKLISSKISMKLLYFQELQRVSRFKSVKRIKKNEGGTGEDRR